MRGNHHDAWVYGGNDPLSGQVAMLDEAKAIGALAKGGWKPKRTIVYCSWDGEEPGLLGSTEFVETHLDELSRKGGAIRQLRLELAEGTLHFEGSAALESLSERASRTTFPTLRRVSSVAARLRARRVRGRRHGPVKTRRGADDLAPRFGLGLQPVLPARGHLGGGPRLRRRGRGDAVPLNLRLVRLADALRRPRPGVRDRALEDRRADRAEGGGRRRRCRSTTAALADIGRRLREGGSAPGRDRPGRRRRRTTRGVADGTYRLGAGSQGRRTSRPF